MIPDIKALCDAFLFYSDDAAGWAWTYPDEEDWESPDCDVMSRLFIDFCALRGVDARMVHLFSQDVGHHYFAVINKTAIDWTAKQFYNVPQPSTDPDDIACPLIFDWPGVYPLSVVTFREESA